jgi:DhnA family fructose-bisphosphate aldolase class Ia
MDQKLARIRAGAYTPQDFIIADAKDADMAFGVATAGPEIGADGRPTGRMRPLQPYRDDMVRMIDSGLIDIMLTSLASCEVLTHAGAYADSDVTPAVRLNDGTDIWVARGAAYKHAPTAPFRTARLDRVRLVADLGLYAISFYNDLQADHRTLEAYAQFRDDASAHGVRHFLEVFNPQYAVETPGAAFVDFNNDSIVRCLAGVSRRDAPIFLKVAYNGPRATEDLASYDPGNIIVGILGGGATTSRDTFELIRQAEKYGARVALFGRRIFFSDDSVLTVRTMRTVIEENLTSAEAVRLYHDELQKRGIRPKRDLAADMELTDEVLKVGMA